MIRHPRLRPAPWRPAKPPAVGRSRDRGPAEEGLVGGRQQQRVAQSGQLVRGPQQRQRLLGGLAQVEAGVDDDPVRGQAGRERPRGPLDQEGGHRGRPRRRRRGSGSGIRGPSRMWVATTRGPGRGRHRQVVGVGEAADVVAHHRAHGVGLPGHRRPPGVDRQGDVEAGPRAAMAGMTRSSSSASPTSGPGPALTPPTSSRSAPSSTNRSARRTRSSRAKVAPLS